MKTLLCRVVTLMAVVAGLCGCQRAPEAEEPGGRVRVVVSIAPQAWLVNRIGGEHVEVISVVSGGDSPVTYQPTDAQVTAVMSASAYFRIGVPFENGRWFQAVQRSEKLRIVDASRGIELRRMRGHAHHQPPGEPPDLEGDRDHGPDPDGGEGLDPHIWLSPRLLKIQARTVTEALSELDPLHQEDFEAALRDLEQELDDLHSTLQERLSPFRGRMFLVFHPAWGYFADEYGLTQVAVEIEGKAPSDADLTALQQVAREAGVRVVFVQRQVSSPVAVAVARAIGGRIEILDPLAEDVPAELLRVAEALVRSYGDDSG